MVQKKLSFGLNEKDAEYFELRTTAHELLEIAQNNSALMADVLKLRRNDKDFFLRKDLQYKKLFFDNYDKPISKYTNTAIKNLLIKYKENFHNLVDLQIGIRLNESHEYTGLMKKLFMKVRKYFLLYPNVYLQIYMLSQMNLKILRTYYLFQFCLLLLLSFLYWSNSIQVNQELIN